MWTHACIGAMTIPAYITDTEGRIAYYNQAAADLWNREPRINEPAELFCGSSRMFTPDGRPLPHDQCPMAEALRTGEPIHEAEIVVERADGSRLSVLANASPIRDEQGEVMGAINCLIDITERRNLTERLRDLNAHLERRVAARTARLEQRAWQLQRLASQLTQVEQRERQKLARVLHDDLQQLLVGMKLQIGMLDQAPPESIPQQVRQLADNIDEAIQSTRMLSHELSPQVLYDSGLPAALRWLAPRKKHRFGLTLHVDADDAANPAGEGVRALLFQSVRELVMNAMKHAHVNEVEVIARLDGEEQVCVSVRDRGPGFDPEGIDDEANDGGKHLGLFGVRERIEALGGRMEIDSVPGQGTTIHLYAPMNGVSPVTSSDPETGKVPG